MDVDAIFQQINWQYEWAMSFCNFNCKSDGRRYEFFFHLITALPIPLQNLVQRLCSQTPWSVSSTPHKVSTIPCKRFGNTLRALFMKNRDFFWYCEIFLPNTWGPLGCLLWPSGPKPGGGNNNKAKKCSLVYSCAVFYFLELWNLFFCHYFIDEK